MFGRGLDGDKANALTLQRAEAAAGYFLKYTPELVVFSGGVSHLAQNQSGSSEAKVMADIACEQGLPHDAILTEEDSTTTFENILYSSEGMLDSNEPIGLLAHKAQLPRISFLAGKILRSPFLKISAEDFGAQPEPLKTRPTEMANYMLSRLVYGGVEPGDLGRLTRRNERYHGVKHFAGRFIGGQPQYR